MFFFVRYYVDLSRSLIKKHLCIEEIENIEKKRSPFTYHSVGGTREKFRALLGIQPDGFVDRVNVALVHGDHSIGIPTFARIPPTNLLSQPIKIKIK